MFGHGSPQHPELPAASFICAFLVLVPLPALWRAGNVATLSIIAWLFVVNVIRGVNTLIWANNIDLRLPVWCDITTKILLGETIALPAAAVCICSYLAAVSDVRTASATLEQRRRRKLFEVFMCYILPMIWMALHYIVQGHRYDIIEHLGCQATVYPSWVALVLLTIFPLVLALVAFAYAVIAIRNFYRRRIDFEKHLQSTNSSLSRGRYLRLMLLASTEMIFDTTANAYTLSFNLTNAGVMLPYTSWADVHSNFSRVQPYPLVLIPTFAWREMLVLWWITPVSTILFFCFFAFGRESMTIYRNWYETLRARFFPRSAKAKAG
ncbi:fungal pheromone STE3G-protein-coupled receptor [Sistotremastrum niveocremeum HHB9708]|uniref:Fungal pheromone STE3G-protein-coupled receptor n=2 Tax=Sistotremastraceae TaxID=3402574 RepID=A0A164Q3B6_9AGAM|nr:fungal pheromone STE3G-protein-coupled receptor [Sistotremastrum niveocremeum HHB9708]KZT37709.1 fungal pheromone STE3G-protein-coupled receptor [Sistotremastrum suecicum HHB10207 ss-3]